LTAKFIEGLRAPARAGAASPLLAFIAGDFADAVAQAWRTPHTEFFALPAARRHAAAIVLAGLARKPLGASELRRTVEFGRDAVVAEALVGAASAAGLMRALSKGGETLWKREEYEDFLQLLEEPMANEVLRHMDVVRPASLAPLSALPQALRSAPIVRVLPSELAARDLALAFDLAVRMRSPDAAGRIARSWGSGGERGQVFGRAYEDLTPDAFRGPEAAPKLPETFERIESYKRLKAVALEFRNCLAEHAGRVAEGRMAVFVWKMWPSIAVALCWDVAGWRLAEAKAADNIDVDEAPLRELVDILARHGVRTGPSIAALKSRLEDHGNGTSYTHQPGPGFLDQLVLGDLWS
jgi:hypothetical protein